MIARNLTGHLRQLADWFPVVSVTGPRQSGKSTLVKETFSSYEYINLEDPEIRSAALEDPVGFVRNRPARLIIDEAQYAPELFSSIQVVADERGGTGQYVISGSQNFLLLKSIKQSLAGRVGITTLLPFSYREASALTEGVDAFTWTGGYPRIYDANMPAGIFYQSYLATYVERDAPELLDVRNLSDFRRLISLCAANAGSLLNYTRLASDLGVAITTVRSWISLLETSYILYLLQPYHANLRKRLTKTPKLYFTDTGLLCHLLGIKSKQELLAHPMRGAVYENLVVSERLKLHLNQGETPQITFYRDEDKREIDVLDWTDASSPLAIEVKSGETYRDHHAHYLRTVGEELGIDESSRVVAYRGSQSYRVSGATVMPIRELLLCER